jgi:hypothetical protein
MVSVFAWAAVRGSLPRDSMAQRISCGLNAGRFPDASTMLKVQKHLCQRYVLGCGDTGFHNFLWSGQGLE